MRWTGFRATTVTPADSGTDTTHRSRSLSAITTLIVEGQSG